MSSDLMLRRKWSFRAHDKQVVFIKKRNERATHVFLKAFLWALYLPSYPDLAVEIHVGDRYKPDVVALDRWGRPEFWGEAGQIGLGKIQSLVRRYRNTHFVIAKWDRPLAPYQEMVEETLTEFPHSAPFDLLNFPPDSAERFIDKKGYIELSFEALQWIRLE